MRFLALGLVLAACEPGEATILHDGDTDIVITAQRISGNCSTEREIQVSWMPPEGTTSAVMSWCTPDDMENDPHPLCWAETLTDDYIDDQGFYQWPCPGHDPAYYWQIDYTAPRPQ